MSAGKHNFKFLCSKKFKLYILYTILKRVFLKIHAHYRQIFQKFFNVEILFIFLNKNRRFLFLILNKGKMKFSLKHL